ncbi:hypothetical protein L6164_011878 [Bauhinia variegata]|uniref:Uncharacterized protein n=1 Tax=Bauhinia variegata TaxID=167791 RepID=A0ACB9P9W1_BAUVA|nr:hypothetical protein L6164_011878 [Bauhinia variegata]
MEEKIEARVVKTEAEKFEEEGEKEQNLAPESSPVPANLGDNVDWVNNSSEKPRKMVSVGEGKETVDESAGNNLGDVSNAHFSANRPLPTSGVNGTNRLAIFFNGNICVYDGIPAEKVQEIMLIAAKSAGMKKISSQSQFTSPIPTRPSSPQGTTNNAASPQAICFPAQKSSICRLQEFPIARRQSLQRFLEKRRDRLGSKAPYLTTPFTPKVADNMDNNFCAENSPDLVSSKPSIVAS